MGFAGLLAEELLAVEGFCKKETHFSLAAWPQQVSQAPVDDPHLYTLMVDSMIWQSQIFTTYEITI